MSRGRLVPTAALVLHWWWHHHLTCPALSLRWQGVTQCTSESKTGIRDHNSLRQSRAKEFRDNVHHLNATGSICQSSDPDLNNLRFVFFSPSSRSLSPPGYENAETGYSPTTLGRT
eukprot:809875-Amphidinium_carterae.1